MNTNNQQPAATAPSTAIAKYVVSCNQKHFYFECASQAYALKAYFETVGLEATVEFVSVII